MEGAGQAGGGSMLRRVCHNPRAEGNPAFGGLLLVRRRLVQDFENAVPEIGGRALSTSGFVEGQTEGFLHTQERIAALALLEMLPHAAAGRVVELSVEEVLNEPERLLAGDRLGVGRPVSGGRATEEPFHRIHKRHLASHSLGARAGM